MGIESFADLLRSPLDRRAEQFNGEQPIVLIGYGAWRIAKRLADGLVLNGGGAFRIHVADPEGPDAPGSSAAGHDSPLREFFSRIDFPDTCAAFEASLDSIRPCVIASCDFLSRMEELDDWLACFGRAVDAGSSLVLSEGTGIDPIEPPEGMVEIGERIWDLMPERYTRIGDSDEVSGSWSEAFEASGSRPANHLVTRLRECFRPEIFTQFGFLAEPFVASAIGQNFDPDASRDGRFFNQVADLDDRKIEAGIAPALHLVARVDLLAED